jgi:hypothetical protein
LQLPLNQLLGTTGEVDEDVVEAATSLSLLGGQPDGLDVHRVERPGDLAHFFPGVHRHRIHGRLAGAIGAAELLGGLRQPPVGDLEGGGAQGTQRLQQRAHHDDEQRDGEQQQRDDGGAIPERLVPRSVATRHCVLSQLAQ